MSNERNPKTDSSAPMIYQIRIKGHVGCRWPGWFEGLTITHEDNGESLVTVHVSDQAALHGLLRTIRDLAMPLISVTQLQIDQTDVADA